MTAMTKPIANVSNDYPSVSRTDLAGAQLEVFGRNFRALSGSVKLSGGVVSGAARIQAANRPSTLGAHVYLHLEDCACVLTTFEVLDARSGQFLVQFAGHVCDEGDRIIRA